MFVFVYVYYICISINIYQLFILLLYQYVFNIIKNVVQNDIIGCKIYYSTVTHLMSMYQYV